MILLAIGFLALLGFIAALAVHVSAAAGYDVQAVVPFVWLLHVGIFVVFVPFVSASRGRKSASTGGSSWRALFPGWPGVAMGVVMAYAFGNFLWFMLTNEGTPILRDGAYLLKHERELLHITEAEFHAHKALETRAFSGLWLVFYLAPALYFLVVRRRHAGV